MSGGRADLSGHTGIVYSRPGFTSQWLVLDKQQQVQPVSIASRILMDDVQAIADSPPSTV